MRNKLLVLLSASVLLFTGCGGESAVQNTVDNSDTKAEAQVKSEPKLTEIVANEDLSNLQIGDTALPVFDALTLAQRREKGLPTALPELKPYSEGKVAYLTFDDGPDNKNTPAILDILKENNVPATFYVTGAHVEANPAVLVRIHNEHHAIGNHSYDHDYAKLYPSVDGFMAEIEKTDEIIMKTIGVRPMVLRAPGGTFSQFTDIYWTTIKANGYVEHDWNVSSADAAPGHPVAQDFIDNINAGTQDGKSCAIILMHSSEGHEETAKALPEIIKLLKERGYKFGVITPMTPQPW